MRLEVRLFGGLAERAGASRVTVELDEPADVDRVRAAVAAQHPTLAPLLERVSVAVDLAVARGSQRVTDTSEVALLPPVAGGAGPDPEPGLEVEVRADGRRTLTGLRPPPLVLDAAVDAIAGPEVGGIATFVGRVRDHAPDLDDPVVRLDYEAYPEMAERVLADLAAELLDGHPALRGVALLHAVGELDVGAPTVLVACAAAHRGPAFAACRQALELVKDRVPVFKREMTAAGVHRWVGLEPPLPGTGTTAPEADGGSPPAAPDHQRQRHQRDGDRDHAGQAQEPDVDG